MIVRPFKLEPALAYDSKPGRLVRESTEEDQMGKVRAVQRNLSSDSRAVKADL
jgi:hypothetical protein